MRRIADCNFLQPLTLDDMRLGEGGRAGSLSLASFEPEFMRPVPPILPIADSEVCRWLIDRHISTEFTIERFRSERFLVYVFLGRKRMTISGTQYVDCWPSSFSFKTKVYTPMTL